MQYQHTNKIKKPLICGKKYLDFNFVSDAIQAADFMRHLDRDVQSELSEWMKRRKRAQ